MTEYHTLTPAYGRDYISKASAKEGLRSGQDFIYASPTANYRCNAAESLPSMLACRGAYCSIRDFRKGDVLNVRYKRQRSVASFTLKEDGKI